MRGVKFILALLAAILIAAAGLLVLRKPIAAFAVRNAMAAQGLPSPQARVTALSLNHIRIEDIASVRPTEPDEALLSIDATEIRFDLREALTLRRVKAIDISRGTLRIDVTENGDYAVAGITLPSGGGQGSGALPFDRLRLSRLTFELATPEGIAVGSLDAQYDAVSGGGAQATIKADRVGMRGIVVEAASASAILNLVGDGAVDANIAFNGGILSPYGQIRDAALAVSGAGASWKDITSGNWRAFDGSAEIDVRDGIIETETSPALARSAGLLGGALEQIAFSGAFAVAIEDGAVLVETGDQPLTFVANTGASLTFDSAMGEPFFVYEAGASALAGVASYRNDDVSVAATLDVRQSAEGWRFNVPVRVPALATEPITLSDVSALLRGTYANSALDFEATVSGAIDTASIGRLSISDASGAATIAGGIDISSKQAVFDLPVGNCAVLDRVSLNIAGQDMDASLEEARLCGADAPLAVVNYANDPITDFSGIMTAQGGSYRLGQTRFVGIPPSIQLAGRYLPADNRTIAQGKAAGGSVVMNEILRFDRADAALDFALEKDAMTIGIDAAQLRMTEYGAAAKVAPILANGSMTLADNVARFTYNALSQDGAPLGAGSGEHIIDTASGEASFQFNRLEFTPNGLQPDRLAPVLKGIIGLTQGAADGDAAFSWSPQGIESRATVTFEDITFRGPGLTVTKTAGVNGEIAFSSVWPVATEGLQTITVSGVDFGALQLEDGEVVFDMPGDETLFVEQAIFPWFGGQIGVRGATAAFSGGNARAPLQVESVNLEQILEFLDVEGLAGAGTLNGELPIIVENSRASFVGGRLTAVGPGRISYVGNAGAAAAEAGGDAQIAFDVLRDLRFDTLSVLIDGPLDGRLDFRVNFEGTGEVSFNRERVRVPVKYAVTLDAALLELLNQAALPGRIITEVKNALENDQP